MSGSFGNHFRIQIFGESHGEMLGAVLEGGPAGMLLDEDRIRQLLSRRMPKGGITSTRGEKDSYQIVSGMYRGRMTGTPLTVLFENRNARSSDYDFLHSAPRPGHADYPAAVHSKGYDDLRGGGHHSGRLTLPLCFCGAVAMQMLRRMQIEIGSHISRIGDIEDDLLNPVAPDWNALRECANRTVPMLSEARSIEAEALIEAVKAEGSSIGAQVECAAVSVPAGLGEPFFDSVESLCAHTMFSIPGVKAVAFGEAEVFRRRGEGYNDCYHLENGKLRCRTNHAGGALGGYTDGMPFLTRVDFRPTASIALPQKTARWNGEETLLQVNGRHDPCIALRAAAAVESAVAIVLLDLLMSSELYHQQDWTQEQNEKE